MNYRIHGKGPRASTTASISATDAASAYRHFLAHKKLFGAAEAFDETGGIAERDLRKRAIAAGWTG